MLVSHLVTAGKESLPMEPAWWKGREMKKNNVQVRLIELLNLAISAARTTHRVFNRVIQKS